LGDNTDYQKLILPHKLSLVPRRRPCLDLTSSLCLEDRPPRVDYPKYSSAGSPYSDMVSFFYLAGGPTSKRDHRPQKWKNPKHPVCGLIIYFLRTFLFCFCDSIILTLRSRASTLLRVKPLTRRSKCSTPILTTRV
jgi:hypothetical protein